ncbi:hypothetical protein [Tsukamurella soli]|uniref:Uncharacterized protein n=1 Tax=Tsukamurella soli TaxID=644556 RepID=A0ABP8JKH8_9ACTN
MTSLFVLDVPENSGAVEFARGDDSLAVDMVGPYFEISGENRVRIDRVASRCRHAVWYSIVAGVRDGEIVQHDKEALLVEHRRGGRFA